MSLFPVRELSKERGGNTAKYLLDAVKAAEQGRDCIVGMLWPTNDARIEPCFLESTAQLFRPARALRVC